jgi:hypothetical protein
MTASPSYGLALTRRHLGFVTERGCVIGFRGVRIRISQRSVVILYLLIILFDMNFSITQFKIFSFHAEVFCFELAVYRVYSDSMYVHT